jgi:hypothetical protein
MNSFHSGGHRPLRSGRLTSQVLLSDVARIGTGKGTNLPLRVQPDSLGWLAGSLCTDPRRKYSTCHVLYPRSPPNSHKALIYAYKFHAWLELLPAEAFDRLKCLYTREYGAGGQTRRPDVPYLKLVGEYMQMVWPSSIQKSCADSSAQINSVRRTSFTAKL